MHDRHRLSRALTVSVILSLVSAAFFAVGAAGNANNRQSSAWTSVSDIDWAEFSFLGYLISNNVWGKGNVTDYSQRIFYDSGSSRFGWDWRWPYNPSQVRGYPEVIYGKKPWNASSTVAHLPCPILDANLEVEFDLSTEATGVYNTAFDIWLTGTKEARPEDILFEIMIWIDNHGMRPLGSVRDTVEIGGMRYDVWVSKRVGEYGWTYICFKAVQPYLTGKIDLGAIMRYLTSAGLVEDTVFLADVEFGNEIIYGSGETIVSTYRITER
jgi:hypothetical protein